MEKLGRVPALDGVRGIAIAAVVAYHFLGLPGGFFGVDVFFVLSGFLITTLLLEEHDRGGRISLRSFYERRARRLLPALGPVLLICGFLAYAEPGATRGRVEGIIATVAYGANVWRLTGHELGAGLTQNWSLSAEEQFYLVWPALLIFLLARKRGKDLAWWLLGAAIAVALWRTALVAWHGADRRIFFGPDTHSDGIISGCALATAWHYELLAGERLRKLLPFALVLLAFAFAVMSNLSVVAYTVGFPLVEVSTAIIVLACVSSRVRLLELRPLVWLGTISYSLYLWQGLAAYFFGRNILGIAVAVLLAWLSYRFIEQMFRRQVTEPASPSDLIRRESWSLWTVKRGLPARSGYRSP